MNPLYLHPVGSFSCWAQFLVQLCYLLIKLFHFNRAFPRARGQEKAAAMVSGGAKPNNSQRRVSLTAQRTPALPPALHCFWQITSPLMWGISAFIFPQKDENRANIGGEAGHTREVISYAALHSQPSVLPTALQILPDKQENHKKPSRNCPCLTV